jgi:NhaP-type Na+/H+ or K+/H+ antiporter
MVLVGSSLAGLAIGCLVSYLLIRLFDKVPTENPILKAEILSVVALGIGMVLAGVGASRLESNDALRYFLIGALLNVPRFLILGFVIGYLFKRVYAGAPDSRN